MERSSFIHIRNAFNPELLGQLRERLRDGFRAEKVNLKQGVGSSELRFDPAWYKPWTTFDDFQLLDGCLMVNYPPQVRWIREDHHLVPWHQDTAYVSRLGNVLTCFVPLDDEPSKHSTLEFGPSLTLQDHVPDTAYGGFKMVGEPVERTYFQLQLGDCLLFGDLSPHRTFVPMGATLERFSFEYRLSKFSEMVPGKDYFDIVKREMIRA